MGYMPTAMEVGSPAMVNGVDMAECRGEGQLSTSNDDNQSNNSHQAAEEYCVGSTDLIGLHWED